MIDATLLPALLSLLAIARSGSVGAAARQHHRTSSAISQQIRKLETELGARLFQRSGNAMIPTPEAQRLAEVVRAAVGRLQSAVGYSRCASRGSRRSRRRCRPE